MSRETSSESVINRMKQTNISAKQIAQYAMLSESDVNKWLKRKKKLPFASEWKIYYLLNLEGEQCENR